MICFKTKFARPSHWRWRWDCSLPPDARRPKPRAARPRRRRRVYPLWRPAPMTRASPTYRASSWRTFQYSLQPLDQAMSEKFFDGYLESLDPRREYFLQSDIDEFAHYRTNLDKFTVGGNGQADLTPAFEIFERFLERLQQRTAYVNQLLKQDQLKFNADDRIATRPPPRALSAGFGRGGGTLAPAVALSSICRKNWTRNFRRPTAARLCRCPKPPTRTSPTQLAQRYNWNLHMVTNWDNDNVLQVYLNALTHAYDPHTDYLNEQHAADFSISMSLSAVRHRRATGRRRRLLHH